MADEDKPVAGEVAQEEELLLPLLTLEDVQQGLSKFLDKNPSASISTMEIPDVGKLHRIDKPWGDATLALLLPHDPAQVFEMLNNLYLPERLSALWHQDAKDIEVIWTALPLAKDQREIAGRKFFFQYGGKKYECEFGISSERLKELASLLMPTTNPSGTQFRNILSFTRMIHQPVNEADKTQFEARSFWIRKVELGDAETFECWNA